MQNVEFKVIDEPWTIIELPDGTVVKMRLVVQSVINHGDMANGLPNFGVNTQVVMAPLFTQEALDRAAQIQKAQAQGIQGNA